MSERLFHYRDNSEWIFYNIRIKSTRDKYKK